MKKTDVIRVGSIVTICDDKTGFKKGTICKLVKKGNFGSFNVICVAPEKTLLEKAEQQGGNPSIKYHIDVKENGYFQYMSQLRKATPEEKKTYYKHKKESK